MVYLQTRGDSARAKTPSPPQTWQRAGALVLAIVVLLAALILSLGLGARDVSPSAVLAALFAPDRANNDHMVIRDLRVPRTLIGLAAGAALALAGTIMQGITRNPLADPGLLGVNSGASLFVILGISWFGVGSASGYVWFAFAGAAAVAVVVYAIGSARTSGATPFTLALAGTAVTAAITSIITLILISDLDALSHYRFWAVGSLVGRDLDALSAVLPFILAGVALALILSRTLNALALGDDLARGLGQRVVAARVSAAVAIVLLCGGATSIAGPIVFVGLVVPHVARRITGPDYRWITAFSLVLGPILLVSADVVGRLIAPPGELEAGLVVALIGAPALVAIVRRNRLATL